MDNITQIVSKLKTINDNLLETIQIFNTYFQDGNLPPFKVDRLKELKQIISFKSFSDIISSIKEDEQLTNNLVDAVFLDLWGIAIDFLEIGNITLNDKKYNDFRIIIIMYGNDIDFYLDALNCLRSNLNNLHNFFIIYGIPVTGKWSIEKYGINLEYNDLFIEALNESDLIKRKNFVLQKLHEAELFKLQDRVDKEDFDEFDDFIDKCYKVVDSIDFQIKNITTTESPNKKNHSIPETGKRPNQSEKIIISTLKDFFIDKTNNGLIQDIQTQFNSYDGKHMAILIYLLQFEFKLIKIVPHSKTISRTQFIRLLKNNFKIKTQSIDKYFISWNNEISVPVSDIEFIDIKEKLTKLIENKVV